MRPPPPLWAAHRSCCCSNSTMSTAPLTMPSRWAPQWKCRSPKRSGASDTASSATPLDITGHCAPVGSSSLQTRSPSGSRPSQPTARGPAIRWMFGASQAAIRRLTRAAGGTVGGERCALGGSGSFSHGWWEMYLPQCRQVAARTGQWHARRSVDRPVGGAATVAERRRPSGLYAGAVPDANAVDLLVHFEATTIFIPTAEDLAWAPEVLTTAR